MINFYFFLPVHNGGDLLKQCVDSILAQRYPNFKLIILNNFSTDNSIDKVKERYNSKIEILNSTEKLNICDSWANINKFTLNNKFSDNDFMILVGHDDYFSISYLDNIHSLIIDNPDASIYQTHFNLVNLNSDLIRKCKPIPTRLYYDDFFKLRSWNHIDVFGTGYAFKINDFNKVGGINTELPLLLFADDLLFIKLSKLSYMYVSKSYEYFYRVHNSASNINSFEKNIIYLNCLKIFIKIMRNDVFIKYNLKNIENDFSYLIYRNVSLYDNLIMKIFLPKEMMEQITELSFEYKKNEFDYLKTLYGNKIFYYLKVVSKLLSFNYFKNKF
jgi:glycosyltransferase involved in cell wall biosynthesis